MDQAIHNKIVSFIWGIADDVLRDLFKRGKYPDVILPMCVLRRLDSVLEPAKQAVLDTKKLLDEAGVTEQNAALCQAAGQAFYNTSQFALRSLKARASQQQLRQDSESYLDGFSLNVQEILDNFKFRNQIPTLSKADALGTLIEKFLDPDINLSPHPVLNGDGSVKHPAMDNHAMGTVFEELVRKFNEDNDEDLRAALYEEFGDALFENSHSVEKALEKRLAEWGNGGNGDEEEDDEEGATARKSLPEKKKKKLLDAKTWERDARLVETATALRQAVGGELFTGHNVFRDAVDAVIRESGRKVSAADLKLILRAVSWREESAPPVIAKIHKPGKITPDALYGRYETEVDGRLCVVEYEPDGDLRDTEQIPLLEESGIEAFFRREVLPYTPDAWIKEDATKIGYEISFTRHFYKPPPLRTLEEIRADILAVEKEAEGLLDELLNGDSQ